MCTVASKRVAMTTAGREESWCAELLHTVNICSQYELMEKRGAAVADRVGIGRELNLDAPIAQ